MYTIRPIFDAIISYLRKVDFTPIHLSNCVDFQLDFLTIIVDNILYLIPDTKYSYGYGNLNWVHSFQKSLRDIVYEQYLQHLDAINWRI